MNLSRRMPATVRPAPPGVRRPRTAVVRKADGQARDSQLCSASPTLIVDRSAGLSGHKLSSQTAASDHLAHGHLEPYWHMASKLRRVAVTILMTALLPAAARRAVAQGVRPKPFQIGWLTGSSSTTYVEFLNAFREGLVELGWSEGRQFVLLPRFADGHLERLVGLAADLVDKSVDLIVATTPPTLAAARHATSQIPIVMVYGPDPAEAGVVASLARPGGNVTGLTSLSVDLSVKQLDLLRAMLPRGSRVAVMWNPANPWHSVALERIRSGGNGRG